MSDQNVGGKIKDLRKKARMSQSELAEKSGIASRAVQRIESGKGNPTLSTLSSIAEVLGVNVEALFGEIKRPPSKMSALARANQLTSPTMELGAQLLDQYAKAPDKVRALVLYFLFGDFDVIEPYLDELADLLPKTNQK